jgi:hypothetical protein
MRNRLLLLLLVLFIAAPVMAQQTPDYSIRNIRTPADEEFILIQFEVVNNGAPSTESTNANVTIATTGELVSSQEVPPLNENEQVTITVTIPPNAPGLTPGERMLFVIRVGIGDIEAENSNTVGDNVAFTPQILIPQPLQPEPTLIPPGGGEEATQPQQPSFTLPFNIDLSNPLHIALLIGAAGILLILVWMLTIILRLLFSRPPVFTTWQPPYVYMPLMNPESTVGRRQLWQQHAQSDALPLPCSSGTFMARKVLIGMNGEKLGGWRVSAMRISQYDMYGRVARSQTVATKGIVNTLDRAVRKRSKLSGEKLQRAVRPAANALLKEFRKRSKRTPTLPIALDIRFTGIHGEVRIVFELYQCVDNRWQMVDQWEPEMTVLSGSITENFTYSLFGQRPSETNRQYRQRLLNDLTQLLTAMIQPPPPVTPPADFVSDTAQVQAVPGDTVGNSTQQPQ